MTVHIISKKNLFAQLNAAMKSTNIAIHLLSVLLIAATLCVLPVNLQAQNARPQQTQSAANNADDAKKPGATGNNASSNVWTVSQEDYYVGPSDVLEIKIEDAPELSQAYTVSVAGFIDIQVIGKLQAINKTPEQIAVNIREELIKADYLKRPRVSVNVAEYNSRTFFIHGSVRTAGAFKIRGKVTILDLIVLAGGMTETHGPNAYIIRRKRLAGTTAASGTPLSPTPAPVSGSEATTQTAATTTTPATGDTAADNQDYEMITANINGLERGKFSQNLVLQPGDVINIPALNVFFIGGEVNAPGQFPLKEGTSLRQAVTLAQGTTFKAAKNRAVIFRGNTEDGKQLEIPVDVDAVMSGKKPDILLQADDLVVIPSSRMKSIGGTVLQAFGMQTVQRGVVFR
jgi:polysaccharide biosynthesis/export protein